MNEVNISKLFCSIGISPNHKGYSYLVYLVSIGAEYTGSPFTSMKDMYRMAAAHFGVSAYNVEYNVRTVVRCYWKQKGIRDIFSSAMHYPIMNDLSVKEFVFVLSEYVATHFS